VTWVSINSCSKRVSVYRPAVKKHKIIMQLVA
jgi:hypothetical protein